MGFYSRIEEMISPISSHNDTRKNGVTGVMGLQDLPSYGNDLKSDPIPVGNRSCNECNNNPDGQDWQVLAASSLTDMDVDDLDQALFLFALRKVQETPTADMGAVWKRYASFWRKRLPREAFRIVFQVYQKRIS